ncbi:TIGR01440 family protein [Paenibacillus sp. ACRRX]|uniref:TIGR01440 family protein n=1 Tax=Paenibacillus sp. ACRRX TaxID=2918206 RepID=UPI001EF739C8|nr:TIGR01440 family protein [Paenibacillus sp. ACRRX]MCG7408049.1 TIGR01440 family protein [Paenibacillus sp. ACRRX]
MTQPDYIRQIHAEAEAAAHVLADAAKLSPGQLVIIGCSTSEVIGQRIGTSGTIELASALYAGLELLRTKYSVQLAYQCCEHLNRALVVERTTCETLRLDEVSAVPVPRAGGSMAAAAYTHFASPCLVETISADAGIDIGETLIGMHLKRVAVPLRTSVRSIGAARVTMAMTRPKLIGGERAVYHPSDTNAQQLSCE